VLIDMGGGKQRRRRGPDVPRNQAEDQNALLVWQQAEAQNPGGKPRNGEKQNLRNSSGGNSEVRELCKEMKKNPSPQDTR
jgi:hypothetical protein